MGILITSDIPITAYYEVNNNNNNEIFALKGANALGTEFYVPITQNSLTAATLYNHIPLAPNALSTFDIVATQDATTVQIYSHTAVDGHPANIPFTVSLNRGQTYSCGFSGANFQNPVNQPSGAAVMSDKPIAITVKEDSKQHTLNSCYDLIGDQIVPVDIIGTDYIVIKGQLNATAGESFFVLATQNNTKVYLDGNPIAVATLFAGQTYFQDNIVNPRYYIQTDKPVYCTQVTGFGCELGSAILPPLNCAGSPSVSFVRSTIEAFYLNIMVKAGSEGNFTLTGGSNPLCITAADFAVVPGTGGVWLSTYGKSFTLAEVPQGVAMQLTNSTDVFGMGLINGAAATGCRFGFFSEYVAKIYANAGIDQNICSNTTAQLNGSVTGGATTGIWTTSGTGAFIPNATTLNAVYTPSTSDTTAGSVTLTLTSSSSCTPVIDQMVLTFYDAPWIDAGPDQSVCRNNPDIHLDGHIANCTGGQWSGGLGTFAPNNITLNAVYTPTAAELLAGTVTLTLTSTGYGTCNPVTNDIVITFTDAPTANAGPDVTVCGNNPAVSLNGAVTIATGGTWTGGTGIFVPDNNTLSTQYTPSPGEISAGSVTLTLTTTGNGNCSSANDNILITISPAPTVSADIDQTKCKNNAVTTLNGSYTVATGAVWSGGTGVFNPDNITMTATYTPTAGELAAGFVNLTLTTTGNGTCIAVSDLMVITFTNAPTVDAGIDQTKCANNAVTTLAGTVGGATGGIWSGGAGTFTPNNTTLNATYTPTPAEIALGTLTLTLTTTGNGLCSAEADQMIITFTIAPTADAGVDQTVCANNANVNLNGSVTVATGGQWTGGTGLYNPGSTALATTYSPSAPEIATGFVWLTLTTTGNGTCNSVSDQIQITFTSAPLVDAGVDQIKCSNNNIATLAGTITGASGGIWSGGMGLFSPDNITLNATYTPTVTELSAGFVNLVLTSTGNGTCLPVSDNVVITYTGSPTVDAGPNQTVGANNPATTLAGTVSGATGGIWSGGAGTYSPSNTDLNAIYTPSALEITAGTVTLTLTTTGNGNCNSVSDVMTITITAAPTVNAGVDQTSCANNPSVTLNGSVTGATGGIWSGGNGTYNPGNTALNAVYTPNAAEISAGTVTLTLTSTGNGPNNPVTDQMTITITPAPTANAGTDITICSNNATVILNGTVTGATGGQWTGGLGFYNPNGNTLNAAYTPTQSEINSGSVMLTLTTTGNGSCIAVTDQMTIFFTPSPTVNAGSDQIVCGNNANVTLNGAITIATGGQWSGGSGTYSPDANTLNAVYTPTAGEIASGIVNLTLTTTGNGTCIAVSDAMIITISPAPVVNAGTNLNSCVNNPSVTLNGSVLNATGGQWSGTTGTYNPGNTTLNAVYTPSAAEISAGSVTLTLTSTGNGSCLAASDQMTINIGPAPVVNAGTDQIVCANNNNVMLNGTSSTTTGQWTGGLGLFTPDNNTLNAIYTPTAGEIASGSLTLTLTSTNNGACNSISDNMAITFTPAPTVNAGSDQIVCASTPNVTLNGSVTVASGGIWTGGSGTYVPNNTTMNATYTPSATEIAMGSVTLTLTSTEMETAFL